jgi:hypothetical protein
MPAELLGQCCFTGTDISANRYVLRFVRHRFVFFRWRK